MRKRRWERSGSESALCCLPRKKTKLRQRAWLAGMWVRTGSLVIGVLGPRKRSKASQIQYNHLRPDQSPYLTAEKNNPLYVYTFSCIFQRSLFLNSNIYCFIFRGVLRLWAHAFSINYPAYLCLVVARSGEFDIWLCVTLSLLATKSIANGAAQS